VVGDREEGVAVDGGEFGRAVTEPRDLVVAVDDRQ
jgi:hypothetical protein